MQRIPNALRSAYAGTISMPGGAAERVAQQAVGLRAAGAAAAALQPMTSKDNQWLVPSPWLPNQ